MSAPADMMPPPSIGGEAAGGAQIPPVPGALGGQEHGMIIFDCYLLI